MKILIPSYNRARCVFALDVFPTATVIVPASQEADYRRCNPGATVQTIPDTDDGNLSRKRNVVASLSGKEPDGAFVAVDDDVCGLWDKNENRAVSGVEAVRVLETLAAQAEAQGAVMFGFNPSGRRPRQAEAEWALDEPFPHLYGFRGASGLTFDEAISGFEMTDFFFQCREAGLKVLRWERYGLEVVRGNLGGLERVKTQCAEGGEALARKWGPRVVELTPDGQVCGFHPRAVKCLA